MKEEKWVVVEMGFLKVPCHYVVIMFVKRSHIFDKGERLDKISKDLPIFIVKLPKLKHLDRIQKWSKGMDSWYH